MNAFIIDYLKKDCFDGLRETYEYLGIVINLLKMEKISVEDFNDKFNNAVKELYYFLYRENDKPEWFHSCLYRLIGKADNFNREKLTEVFPFEVLAYCSYISYKDKTMEKFFNKFNLT